MLTCAGDPSADAKPRRRRGRRAGGGDGRGVRTARTGPRAQARRVVRQGGDPVGRADKEPAHPDAVRDRAGRAPARPRCAGGPGPAGRVQPAGPRGVARVRVRRPAGQAGRGRSGRQPAAGRRRGPAVRRRHRRRGPGPADRVPQVPARARVPGPAGRPVPRAVELDRRAAQRRQPAGQPVRVRGTGDPGVRPAERPHRHRGDGAGRVAAGRRGPRGAPVRRPAGRAAHLRRLPVAAGRLGGAAPGRRLRASAVRHGADGCGRAPAAAARPARLRPPGLGHARLLAVRRPHRGRAVLPRFGHVQDGRGRRPPVRRRPRAPGEGRVRAPGRRQLGHAADRVGQHKRGLDHDRREGIGSDQGVLRQTLSRAPAHHTTNDSVTTQPRSQSRWILFTNYYTPVYGRGGRPLRPLLSQTAFEFIFHFCTAD